MLPGVDIWQTPFIVYLWRVLNERARRVGSRASLVDAQGAIVIHRVSRRAIITPRCTGVTNWEGMGYLESDCKPRLGFAQLRRMWSGLSARSRIGS